jgi:hypothetical protein
MQDILPSNLRKNFSYLVFGHAALPPRIPKQFVINTITSPELWAYASRVKTGNDMRQRLNQGQASLHGLCTFLFVSEGQVVNARLEGVAA